MASFSSNDGRHTTSSATHCSSSLPRPPPVATSSSSSSFLSSGQSQQQQSRQVLKFQRRRRDNRTTINNNNNNKSDDCLDSTRHSSASSIGTRNINENGKGLSTVVALPPVLVSLTSSSSTSSTSLLLTVTTPGLDRTDHSSLTSSSISVATTEDLIVKRVDENISQANGNDRIRNRYIDFSSDDDSDDDDDVDDDNSLGSFGFNDSDDDEVGDDNIDDNLGVNEETNHVVEKLASSLSRTHVHYQRHQQQQQGQKQPKFHQPNQQSFHDSTVSFSSQLTEVIDVVPNLSPTSKGKYFYSYDELSEFRVEYEFELEGLLPPGSDES